MSDKISFGEIAFVLCMFGAVSLVAYFLSSFLLGREEEHQKVRDRLTGGIDAGGQRARRSVAPLLQQLGAAAASPFMPKTREGQSSLRRNLAFAGIYSAAAIRVMTGCKVLLLAVGLVGGYAVGVWMEQMMLGVALGGLAGYLMPTLWLKLRIRSNQQALDRALPDTLDLLVVCVEAGLTVDAAMQRVGQELALAHPSLSRELSITHMETRVGVPRTEAMKNMGNRTGLPGLQSLASMLIQAERFGTSIASALRIHAASMRQARQFAAEEHAAKASVKMSFPLVLFIFPATFIVLAGPTVIDLLKSPLFR